MPIERYVILENFLATDTQKERKKRQPELRACVDIPEHALVRLDLRINRPDLSKPGKIGPVDLVLEVAGQEVFTHTLESNQQHANYTTAISLAEWSGPSTDLTLRMVNHNPERTSAHWHRATLEQVRLSPRLAASSGPNLLFVVVDTLRADHCSLYGYPRKTTPFLEKLAEQAMVFDRALAPASWTLPSMASLLTGLYPTQHGSINGEALDFRLDMTAEILQQTGFTTFAVSANPLIGPNHGFDQGFETFHHVPWQRAEQVNSLFATWLRNENTDLRWFALLHYIDPHDPYDAPLAPEQAFTDQDYNGLFIQDTEALLELSFTVNLGLEAAHSYGKEDIEYLKAAYDGEILYWDQQFEKLTELLREKDLFDNTIIVVMSDHGEEFADHGMFKHGPQLFEESIRVPLLIRAPGGFAGQRRSSLVEARSVLSAIQRLCSSDAKIRPADIWPTATAEKDLPAFSHTRYAVSIDDPHIRRTLVAVTDSRWKLIKQREQVRLFDLARDPLELTDLAAERPKIVKHYRGLLAEWKAGTKLVNFAGPDQPSPLSPESEEALRALGYIK